MGKDKDKRRMKKRWKVISGAKEQKKNGKLDSKYRRFCLRLSPKGGAAAPLTPPWIRPCIGLKVFTVVQLTLMDLVIFRGRKLFPLPIYADRALICGNNR